jgi:hypothetical protein
MGLFLGFRVSATVSTGAARARNSRCRQAVVCEEHDERFGRPHFL